MQFSISLAYDIVLAALVLLVAFNGKRRGLLSGLMGLVGTVAGLLGAVYATRRWAPAIYTDYLGVRIGERVTEAVAQSGGDVSAALQSLSFLPESIRNAISAAVQNVSGDIAPQVVSALEPVLLPLIQTVLFVLVSVVIRWAVRLVAGWLRGFNGVPLLGTVNQMLGFAFGFVSGIIDCWLACMLLWLVSSVAMGKLPALSEATLNQSVIYSFFARFNPFLMHY